MCYFKKLFLFFILVISGLCNYAQVNFQNGSATFSLPVFNWKDDKSNLTSIVALTYNSGNGLKVDEVASDVGQGWNLIAGGVISRVQIGEPDDQLGRDGATNYISKYPSGYLYASNPAYFGCPNALSRYPIYKGMNQLYTQHNSVAEDRELDHFMFQFNGKGGMFVLNPTQGNIGSSLVQNDMKITFEKDESLYQQGIRTTITSFTIQDKDGLIYRFKTKGLTKVLETSFCDPDQKEQQKQPNFENKHIYHQSSFENSNYVSPWIVNSWYLTEVEDPFTHRKIIFNYTILNLNVSAGADISYNYSKDKNTDKDYIIISHKRSITQTPSLRSISFPDGHKVLINQNTLKPRVDLIGTYPIGSIDIKYNNRFLSRFKLNTTYFISTRLGNPVFPNEMSVARLCLKSIQKIGVDLKEDSPPYIFDYYLGTPNTDDVIPPPFFYAKDIWGFANGNNSGTYETGSPVDLKKKLNDLSFDELQGLCFLRNDNPNVVLNSKIEYAKTGLLRQIIYPTGGTLTYNYMQNRGVLQDNAPETFVGGVHVSQTESTDGGYSNPCSEDKKIVTNYNYVLENSTLSSLWGLEMPEHIIRSYNHFAPEIRKYHWSLSNILGICYYRFMYPGILSQQQAIDLPNWQNIMQFLAPVLGILNTITTICDVANLIGGSTGFLAWAAVAVDIIGGLVTLGITCFHDYSNLFLSEVYYNTDLNAANPLPTQFKRVEVVENPGTIGKTVYTFTSNDENDISIKTNTAFSAQPRYFPWVYGLPKLTTVFDNQNHKIKETENQYDFFAVNHFLGACGKCTNVPSPISTSLASCKCNVTNAYSERGDNWDNKSEYDDINSYVTTSDDMDIVMYGYTSGKPLLMATFEREFNKIDETKVVLKETDYNYYYYDDGHYYLTDISTTGSNGDTYYKEIDYSGLHSEPVFQTLKANNVIELPVRVKTRMSGQRLGNSLQTTSDQITDYSQISSGDIKISQIREQRYDQPGVAHPGGYKIIQSFTYDADGHSIGIKDEGGRIISNLYDYDDKYVVASVIDADPLLDLPAYTSFETSKLGGWTLNGTGAVRTDLPAVTGFSTFLLTSSNSLSANLNTSKAYKLSFWATNSSVQVTNGASLITSVNGINGFTYYEYLVPQGASSVTLSSTNTTIDELRLYPANSRMRTISYDPLIGKTAECDDNNRITYYEYDNLGRLHFIKDKDMNVIKMYEYNNISPSKQNGCPGVYYNHLISENFTRSNCNSGYQGGGVLYTIPANKYMSTISQDDADAQAEEELLAAAQQNADNLGSCSLIYYNNQQSGNFTAQNCDYGYIEQTVTYTVPANKYASLISQQDADNLALAELNANGQFFANNGNNCQVTTDPDWESDDNSATLCMNVGGLPHLFLLATDMNPQSSTFQQTQWKDSGPSNCTVNHTVYAKLSYENINMLADGTFVGDVVVRFFADGNATMPLSVNDLLVICDHYDGCNYDTETLQFPHIYGGEFTLFTQVHLVFGQSYNTTNEMFDPCYEDYSLELSSDYIIIQ